MMRINSLLARLPSSGVASIVGKPQAHETIRVIVFDGGGDAAVFDVPRRGEN
jgi:hypothetical protein